MKRKLNMTVGRFQPFTQGHLNMVNDGDCECIVYQIIPPEMPNNVNDLKIKGKKVKKEQISNVIDYINNGAVGNLTDIEKELIKRPFTNDLIKKELDIVKKRNKNIVDIVYVQNAYQALHHFNNLIRDNDYEAQYWMCGDDRVDSYTDMINNTDIWKPTRNDSMFSTEDDNILIGKLRTNIGTGRTEGISGTAVRESIIQNDKSRFTKIMPNGVESMFDDFKNAFIEFESKLKNIIKEMKTMAPLSQYILEQKIKNN